MRNRLKLKYGVFKKDGEDGEGGGSGGEDLSAVVKDLQAQLEKVKAKNDELLTETKKAKQERKEAEEAAAKEAAEKAKAQGDYKQLFEAAEQEKTELSKQFDELKTNVRNSNLKTVSLEISGKLADGDNAELLSTFVKSRLGEFDDITDDVKSLVSKEFQNNAKFAALLKGNQSSGGGASGGNNSGGAAKVITRSEFEGKTPNDRMAYIKDGGKITD